MREKKMLVAISNGKKITIPDVTKIIMSIKNTKREHTQASIDITKENLDQVRRIIRRAV